MRRGETFVEVPGTLIPPSAHPSRWAFIPRFDEDPSPCGAFMRVEDRDAELWCLKHGEHSGRHGWEEEEVGSDA